MNVSAAKSKETKLNRVKVELVKEKVTNVRPSPVKPGIHLDTKVESLLEAFAKDSEHAAGSLVEKLGRAFERAGFKTIGTAVEEAGDKIQREAD